MEPGNGGEGGGGFENYDMRLGRKKSKPPLFLHHKSYQP